jgi:hypothetical protein
MGVLVPCICCATFCATLTVCLARRINSRPGGPAPLFIGFRESFEVRNRRDQTAEFRILSPLRLPFRHAGPLCSTSYESWT